MSDIARHTTIAEELKNGNTVTFFTVGNSMYPLLMERETHATVAPIDSIRKGDILLYIRSDGDYVLHRLIKANKDHCYMRGDNTYGLECIRTDQVIGKVTHIYRHQKTVDVEASKGYKLYVFAWMLLYPCRWLVWKIRLILRRIFRKQR